MSRGKRKNKVKGFYIDTNIAIDYITGRNPDTIGVLDLMKEKGWKIVSSSFLVMEASDVKKDYIYIINKTMEEKWDIRRVLRERDHKDLTEGDFFKLTEWIDDLKDKLNLLLYDFLVDSDTWELAQYISQNSNLFAPDAIHLSSAIIASQGGIEIDDDQIEIEAFVTNDSFIKEEAEKIKKQLEIDYPEVLTIGELKKKFLGVKNHGPNTNFKSTSKSTK